MKWLSRVYVLQNDFYLDYISKLLLVGFKSILKISLSLLVNLTAYLLQAIADILYLAEDLNALLKCSIFF